MTIVFNYRDNEIVSSPTVIVSGRTSTGINQGIIQFINDNNTVFPPQYAEVHSNGNFKALLHVSPGKTNTFEVEVSENGLINSLGFPDYKNGGQRHVVDLGKLSLKFNPLTNNKPVHLCLILGRDSNGSYDMPSYRLKRGEVANLDSAVKKLKVAGRLMQSFTQDDFRSVGLSNRSFQFVEETVSYQGIYGYTVNSPTPHQEVKVHVLRSPKTVAELRDPNLAQQNPKANNNGGLFSHAIDLVKKTPEIYAPYQKLGTAIQCAVLYLDAHFDVKEQMILTHAALGGGTGEVKMAIFGSHGLHSWPINFPQVGPSFLDSTHLSTNEVANDCNQCGTSWECFNITLGAFMHEIGHLLGSPHQVDGVMLRDYIWWNRSFMTREAQCLRTKSAGEMIRGDGTWPKVCHWNRLDILRYLHHDSFTLPIDQNDSSFGKTFTTLMRLSSGADKIPTSYNTPSGALIKSDAGIFLVELVTKDLARHHYAWYPKAYGGPGLQHELKLEYNQCYQDLKKNTKDHDENFAVRILSLGGDLYIKNFKEHCKEHKENIIKSDFGLNRGILTGYKSSLLGKSKDKGQIVIGFDLKTTYKIRIYHGGALDGVSFYFTLNENTTSQRGGQPPKVPRRDYLNKLVSSLSMSEQNSPSNNKGEPRQEKHVLIGNEKKDFSEFKLSDGEYITKFHFRDGAWIDAIQFETNTGRKSPMFGNANGGHASTLEAPSVHSEIIGMYGYKGSWLDGLGIIYTTD